jgi:hypothetical protein
VHDHVHGNFFVLDGVAGSGEAREECARVAAKKPGTTAVKPGTAAKKAGTAAKKPGSAAETAANYNKLPLFLIPDIFINIIIPIFNLWPFPFIVFF